MNIKLWLSTSVAILLILASLGSGSRSAQPKDGYPFTSESIAATVFYGDQMLIVSHEKGVVLFAFKEELDKGVKYVFRSYDAGTATETTGAGTVIWKYRNGKVFKDEDGKKAQEIVDEGSINYLVAGAFKLYWTHRTKGSGWVYYEPEKARIQIAHPDDFKDLDLKRFKWK